MKKKHLLEKAKTHMEVLCTRIPDRRVGSEGNRAATDYLKQNLEKLSWAIEETKLTVMDWKTGGAMLTCDSRSFEVFSSHYSRGCNVAGELLPVDTLEKLENSNITGKIVLLYGAIAATQIVPKNFIFYTVDEHKRIIDWLEKGDPLAVVCATGRDSATAGGVYPFPLFEDGDFDIPSVYMTDMEGEKLLAHAGKTIQVVSKAERIPETAFNIIARKNEGKKRIVISAHIDAKIGTPGAIDNATGVTILMLLAEMLKDYRGNYTLELAAFNGEDYYAATGQMKYLEQNKRKFDDILLNINIDGAGLKNSTSSFSAFDLPADIRAALDKIIVNQPNIVEGLPWYQGDHSMFIQQGCPAIAVSSHWFIENMENQDITHTPKDNLNRVDYERIAECAEGIKELIDAI